MKKYFVFFLFLSQSILFAQNSQSLSDFSAISISGNFDITLISSNDPKVDIVSSNVDKQDILTEVKGNKLEIRFKKNIKTSKNKKATLNVYYQNLNSISTSASASVKGDELIKTDNFNLEASSASQIILKLETSKLVSDVSSAASVTVSGQSNSQTIDVSSGASYKGFDLTSEKVVVDVSSGARAQINASESLLADASSGGSVQYTGSPEIFKTDTSSGGSVRGSDK